MLIRCFVWIVMIVFLFACNQREKKKVANMPIVNIRTIENSLKELASDKFMGRKPFTKGEDVTVNFLVDQLKSYGLEPGNENSFIQQVNLVELNASPDDVLRLKTPQGEMSFKSGADFVVYSERVEEQVSLEDSELVFAGFGVVAPEYNWNDYKDLDVKGKTVIVLVNDPGFGTGDDSFFKGDIMTYYGRWTYKYEEAMRQGAAGVLIVHETVPAGYGWAVVKNSWSGARLYLDEKENATSEKPSIQGWISRDAAIKIFKSSGVDLSNFHEKSRAKNFRAVSLNSTLSIGLTNDITKDVSKNVVAMISGAKKEEEYVIYSAHWDHLGVGIPVNGDSIYNGAHDNASGAATLLGIAEAFSKSEKPDRSVVFLFVTGEEQGLLGSAFYAENPIFPPQETIANVNMDGVTFYGKMKDLTVIGHGQSELDDLAEKIAKKQGRYIMPDPDPGKGYFFRSDHFSFAKIGIPAIFASGSYESMDKGVQYVDRMTKEFLATSYHKPADEFKDSWNFEGMEQDGQLFLEMGLELSKEGVNISWKEGSEFKPIRDKSMRD